MNNTTARCGPGLHTAGMSDTTLQSADKTQGSVMMRPLNRFAEAAGAPVACAVRMPVMLDVMGGIAELTGALAVATPTRESVRLAAAPRDDQRLRIVRLDREAADRAQRNGHDAARVWQLAQFYDGDALATPEVLRTRMADIACSVERAVLRGAYALLAGRLVPHLAGGFTLLLDLDRAPAGACDAQILASVQNATAAALLQALTGATDARRLVEALRQVRGADGVAVPVGLMTQAGPFLGKSGELLQVCCGSFDVGTPLALPAGVTLVGIDCGVLHPQADGKYGAAFTAALMGREIIARLMPMVCPQARWDGMLARVSVTDFVDQLRDRIPTKLKGAQYLERFGPPADAPVPVDPAAMYKVRSRAEHHIYEEDRVRQFAERLARARRTGDELPVREAGEYMYASHWSYGQRCGLGSIETDLLVSLLRVEGDQQGIFGARVSGAGCGGTVVVLLRDNLAAQDTLERVLATYRQKTRRTPHLRPIADASEPAFSVEKPA